MPSGASQTVEKRRNPVLTELKCGTSGATRKKAVETLKLDADQYLVKDDTNQAMKNCTGVIVSSFSAINAHDCDLLAQDIKNAHETYSKDKKKCEEAIKDLKVSVPIETGAVTNGSAEFCVEWREKLNKHSAMAKFIGTRLSSRECQDFDVEKMRELASSRCAEGWLEKYGFFVLFIVVLIVVIILQCIIKIRKGKNDTVL